MVSLQLKSQKLLLPSDELVLSYGVKKTLQNFEDYPNDPQRGFNLPHMPIYYRFASEKEFEEPVHSTAMLVITPAPDFSMPFNVNAVTHVLFGALFINTVYVLMSNYKQDKLDSQK